MNSEWAAPVKLVGYNVDTWYLNVRRKNREGKLSGEGIDDDLAYHLDDLQSQAQAHNEPVATPWYFGGEPLLMQTHGAGRGQWRWLLTSPLFALCISRGRLKGHILAQVRLSSQYLWSHQTPGLALCDLEEFLITLFPYPLHLQVSEVHLCADVAGWNVEQADWQRGFISRAVTDTGRLNDASVDGPDRARRWHKHLATLEFGSHGSRLSCSIYNKSLEIETSGKSWFRDIWQRNGWDGCSDVWRVEFRFRREFLHAAGIEWAYDLTDVLKTSWEYAAGHDHGGPDGLPDGWLRYVIPNEQDSNRARWPVHPARQVVQRAFREDAYSDIGNLVFKRTKERNVLRALDAVSGYITSIVAQGDDLYPELNLGYYDVMEWLTHSVEINLKVKERDFYQEVDKKRPRYVRLPASSEREVVP
jgi:hypothetical protein